MIEISPVPEDIQNVQLEESIAKLYPSLVLLFPLAIFKRATEWNEEIRWSSIAPAEKKRNDVIFKKKSLNGKSDELKNLGFTSAKLFDVTRCDSSDSMCHENHQLSYRCRQLKWRGFNVYVSLFFVNCAWSSFRLLKPNCHYVGIQIVLDPQTFPRNYYQ